MLKSRTSWPFGICNYVMRSYNLLKYTHLYIKLCAGLEQDDIYIYMARFLYLCRKGKNQQIQVKLIKGKNKSATKMSSEYLQNINCSSIKYER
jgi:hypothetical protein